MQYTVAREYGFARRVEEYQERKSYPHRSRTAVGEVPEPHYDVQDRFKVDNPAFKGYGIDSKVPSNSACPFALDSDSRMFCTGNENKQERAPTALAVPQTTSLPQPLPTFRTRIEPLSSARNRNTSKVHPGAPQPESSRPRAVHHEPPRVGVGDLLKGYGVEKQPEARPTTAQLLPAGRPTSSGGAMTKTTDRLFDKELSPEQMRSMLDRCGAPFQNLHNSALFNKVWLHASGGEAPAAKLPVRKFQESIDVLGL